VKHAGRVVGDEGWRNGRGSRAARQPADAVVALSAVGYATEVASSAGDEVVDIQLVDGVGPAKTLSGCSTAPALGNERRPCSRLSRIKRRDRLRQHG